MKSLAGVRVMITRPQHQTSRLKEKLEALGAEVFSVPVVTIAPPEDPSPLRSALAKLAQFDWVVVTSVNGVEAVRAEMDALGLPREDLERCKLAAIGPATAEALAKAFRPADLVPGEYVSEAIADALPDVKGLKFLLARADLARVDLATKLRAMGAEVMEVAAYRIVRLTETELPDEAPDAITLTSAEITRATFDVLRKAGREDWLKSATLACIGPITASAVRDLGYEPTVMATKYDIPGLIEALVDHLGKETAHA